MAVSPPFQNSELAVSQVKLSQNGTVPAPSVFAKQDLKGLTAGPLGNRKERGEGDFIWKSKLAIFRYSTGAHWRAIAWVFVVDIAPLLAKIQFSKAK